MTAPEQANLHIDGGARGNPGPAGAAYVITTTDGQPVASDSQFIGVGTNNVAEYTALIDGLEAAAKLGVRQLQIVSDSELLVRQIIGEYRVRSENILDLYHAAQMALMKFDRWQIRHVPRSQNREADRLVNAAIDAAVKGRSGRDAADRKLDSSTVKVLAQVARAPAKGACGAGLRKGQRFVFDQVTPAGLCLHAAHSLLPTVMAMQADPAIESDTQVTVRCGNPDCGAVFHVSVVS